MVVKGTEHLGILPHSVFLYPDFLVNFIWVRLPTVEALGFWKFLGAFQSVVFYHPAVQYLRSHGINDFGAQKRSHYRDLLQVREYKLELPDGVHQLNQVPHDWGLWVDELREE